MMNALKSLNLFKDPAPLDFPHSESMETYADDAFTMYMWGGEKDQVGEVKLLFITPIIKT